VFRVRGGSDLLAGKKANWDVRTNLDRHAVRRNKDQGLRATMPLQ